MDALPIKEQTGLDFARFSCRPAHLSGVERICCVKIEGQCMRKRKAMWCHHMCMGTYPYQRLSTTLSTVMKCSTLDLLFLFRLKLC